MLPDNEFSNDIDGMPSMDFAYRNELLHYDRITCPCGETFSRLKTDDRVICGKCSKKKITELVEQNRENL